MKKQYLITERAHFMCPNMHFGIIMEIEKIYDKQRVEETIARMAKAHPFLRSLIAREEGTDSLFYDVKEESKIEVVVKSDKDLLWKDYKKLSEKDWNVFENGLFKIYLYPEEKKMTVLLVAHHLLTDGRGLLGLAQEFVRDYIQDVFPNYVEENLIESIEDLPENSSLSGVSKWLVKRANKQWEKENQQVSYEQYKAFVESFGRENSLSYSTYQLNRDSVEEMVQLCKEHGISMNDLFMAHMYVKTGAKKIIIAADIREKFAGYKKGALGNYSTAMGISCKSKTNDIIKKAKEVHKIVQKNLNNSRVLMLVLACYFELSPTLLDAAAISALGGFDSKAGRFVGNGMFGFSEPKSHSITNLGKLDNENIKSLIFVPPASPAAKLTLGVVTLNGVLRACSSKNH